MFDHDQVYLELINVIIQLTLSLLDKNVMCSADQSCILANFV